MVGAYEKTNRRCNPESSESKDAQALLVSVLDRLRIYTAAPNRDKQDVVALLPDQHLPHNLFPETRKLVV
jgi:hypothetical protein